MIQIRGMVCENRLKVLLSVYQKSTWLESARISPDRARSGWDREGSGGIGRDRAAGCPLPLGYQISWQSWLNPDKKWPNILTFPVLHLINYRYQTGDSWCAQEFEVPLKENQVPLARKVPQVTGLPLVSQKFQSKTMNLGIVFQPFSTKLSKKRWWFSSLSSLNPDRQTGIFSETQQEPKNGDLDERKIAVKDHTTKNTDHCPPPWLEKFWKVRFPNS